MAKWKEEPRPLMALEGSCPSPGQPASKRFNHCLLGLTLYSSRQHAEVNRKAVCINSKDKWQEKKIVTRKDGRSLTQPFKSAIPTISFSVGVWGKLWEQKSIFLQMLNNLLSCCLSFQQTRIFPTENDDDADIVIESGKVNGHPAFFFRKRVISFETK